MRHFTSFIVAAAALSAMIGAAAPGAALALQQDAEAQMEQRINSCNAGSAVDCAEAGFAYASAYASDPAGPDAEAYYSAAVSYLDLGCQKGDGSACDALGREYSVGSAFLAADMAKSFGYYQAGCSLGDAYACGGLAVSYYNGQGVEKNPEQAFQYYSSACASDVMFACRNLGYMYLDGAYVEQDAETAYTYIGSACEAGDGEACYAYSYKFDDTTDEGYDAAMDYVWEACDLGLEDACLELEEEGLL